MTHRFTLMAVAVFTLALTAPIVPGKLRLDVYQPHEKDKN